MKLLTFPELFFQYQYQKKVNSWSTYMSLGYMAMIIAISGNCCPSLIIDRKLIVAL